MLSYLSRFIFIFCIFNYSAFVWADLTLTEANLKSRFVHQFIIFAEWPESTFSQASQDYKVGIIGDQVMVKVYQQMKNTDIGQRKVIVELVDENASKEKLSQYNVLFIRKKSQKKLPEILNKTAGLAILTISEFDKSEDSSAIINFVDVKNKLRFSIDEKKANTVGIKFRSQLLRLAIPRE